MEEAGEVVDTTIQRVGMVGLEDTHRVSLSSPRTKLLPLLSGMEGRVAMVELARPRGI